MNTVLEFSLAQYLGRLTIVVASVVALVLADVAADQPTPVNALFVVATASIVTAITPDRHLGLLVFGGLAIYWAARAGTVINGWTLLGALALLVAHLATAFVAGLPESAPVPTATVRIWANRALMVAGLTAGVWAVIAVRGGRQVGGIGYGVAAGGLCVGLAAVGASMMQRRRSGDGTP